MIIAATDPSSPPCMLASPCKIDAADVLGLVVLVEVVIVAEVCPVYDGREIVDSLPVAEPSDELS